VRAGTECGIGVKNYQDVRVGDQIECYHVGSLDPLATGMLPICLGEATKIAGDILSGRKLYRFTITLGSRTATGDTEGAVVETAPVPEFDSADLNRVLGSSTDLKRKFRPCTRL
jgi:tRNA pseudouridine55 synthase